MRAPHVLSALVMFLVLLLPARSSATGVCEDLRTTYTFVAIDDARGELLIESDIEWCEYIEEEIGVVTVTIVRTLEGIDTAWYTGANSDELDRVDTPPGDPESLKALEELLAVSAFVDPATLEASPSGRCATRIEEKSLDGEPDEFDSAEVHLVIEMDDEDSHTIDLGERADDEGTLDLQVLYLPSRRFIAVWASLPICEGGPPPGYFGEDDSGSCYVGYETRVDIVSLDDVLALGGCFAAPETVADDKPYVVIVKSFRQSHHDASTNTAALVTELIAAGFQDAASYDSRIFADLTDGYITVLATRTATRDEAKVVLEQVKNKGFEDAYVKKAFEPPAR